MDMLRRRMSRAICIWAAGVVSATSAATGASAAVIYVDADASNGGNGQSWATAYNDLQDALAIAVPGDQIWVADGIYFPDDGTGNRAMTFTLKPHVPVYGGFAGNENTLSERNWTVHFAVLSGDLNENDGANFTNYDDNSFNVVTSSPAANGDIIVLDGVTVEGGNANGSSQPANAGGGVRHRALNNATEFYLINCTVQDCRGREGAGIYAQNGVVVVDDCLVQRNFAYESSGGGAALSPFSFEIRNCDFVGNRALGAGGGVRASGHSNDSLVATSTFVSNLADGINVRDGGGILIGTAGNGNAVVTMLDCLFEQNDAGFGYGGGCAIRNNLADIGRCIFFDNVADIGGGLFFDPSGPARQILNCSFLGNEAVEDGGGLAVQNHDHVIANCLVSGNSAGGFGGGLFLNSVGPRFLTNIVCVSNTAGGRGGGMFVWGAVDVDRIQNCIAWNNSSSQGNGQNAQIFWDGSTRSINYSCVQGWTGAWGGSGNSGQDPLFVDLDGADGIPGTLDDDLRLGAGSPSIDSGNNLALPADYFDFDGDGNTVEAIPFDLIGNARQIDDPDSNDTGNGSPPIVDKGAFEFGDVEEAVEYIGPTNGSWFVGAHWSSGVVPAADTNVEIGDVVVVDGGNAFALDIALTSGGGIVIEDGALTARNITIPANAFVGLNQAGSTLTVHSISVLAGGDVLWTTGTICLDGGQWSDPDSITIGCGAPATLRLLNGGGVIADSILICSNGVVEGSGSVLCDVTNEGILRPGFPLGNLTISGSLLQEITGTIEIELEGYEAGVNQDHIDVQASAMLDGTLSVLLLSGFEHMVGERAIFLDAGEILGDFAVIDIPDLPGIAELLYQEEVDRHLLYTMLESTNARLYVNEVGDPSGDGQSWASATQSLDSALAVARFFPGSVEEIWVAAGQYVPTRETIEGDPLSARFDLVEGASIFGGFAGDETELDERDPALNVTALSGDRLGDDLPNFQNYGDNVTTIVRAEGGNPYLLPTMVDGLTISGSTSWSTEVFVVNPMFAGCRFIANAGGGMLLSSASTIVDCEFVGNRRIDGAGAGLNVLSIGVAPTIQRCLFDSNMTTGQAGGTAGLSMGAERGFISHCTFINNQALGQNGRGGAMSVGGDVEIVNCAFLGNVAMDRGGAVVAGGSVTAPVFFGCTFGGNFADRDGGAVWVSSNGVAAPRFVNCAMYANQAGSAGGGFYAHNSTDTVIVSSSIVWDNVDAAGQSEASQLTGPGTYLIDYSCVQNWTGGLGGTGNFGLNPLFADADGADNLAGTLDDDVRLTGASPCIDAGDNQAGPSDSLDLDGDCVDVEPVPVDLDSFVRHIDDLNTTDTGNGEVPIIDIGAYEFGSDPWGPGYYVGPSGGNWFVSANWRGGVVPHANMHVVITTLVVIDQPGAHAADVAIMPGGGLSIGAGSLGARQVSVAPGAGLFLTSTSTVLDARSLYICPGSVFEWLAGTIRINGGPLVSAADLVIGEVGPSTLILTADAVVNAPAMEIHPFGTLAGQGSIRCSVLNDGRVTPGESAGILTIVGDYSQTPDGLLVIEIGGYSPGTEFDAVHVEGTAILAGELRVEALGGLEPRLGAISVLVTQGTTGAFGEVNLPLLPDGFTAHHQSLPLRERVITAPPGPVVYVSSTAGSGEGTSWADATADLDLAFLAASYSTSTIEQVWVKAGTYTSNQLANEADPRSASFWLADGLGVYGGFAGNESSLDQRNVVVNVTILSGDRLGDDEAGFINRSDNAFHVVRSEGNDGTAILDGFTISGGHAIESLDEQHRGAGAYCINSMAQFANCTYFENRAHTGSGMYIFGGQLELNQCSFIANTNAPPGNASGPGGGVYASNAVLTVTACEFTGNASSSSGGGLFAEAGADVTITDTTFTSNLAGASNGGGGVCGDHATFNIVNCHFEQNGPREQSGPVFGGAAHFAGDQPVNILNCTFTNNLANGGGAVALAQLDQATLTGCDFTGNTAATQGGALSNHNSSPFVEACDFTANIANRGGAISSTGIGGAYVAFPVFDTCTFANNTAIEGGGAYLALGTIDNGEAILSDCIFTGNSAQTAGGGLFNNAVTTLNNCSLSGNNAPVGDGIYAGFFTLSGTFSLAPDDSLYNRRLLVVGVDPEVDPIGTIATGGFVHRDEGLTATIRMDIAGEIAGVEHDLIDADGSVEIDGGGLIIDFINGFVPTLGQEFTPVMSSSLSGAFDVIGVNGGADGSFLEVTYSAGGVSLAVQELEGIIDFTQPNTVGFDGDPTDAVLADFDGDGDLDIASTVPEGTIGQGAVVILLNAGNDVNGTWQGFTGGQIVVGVDVNPIALVAADFNGDSAVDLAVVNEFSETVAILLNNNTGDGTLSWDSTINVGPGATDIQVGPIDGNATIDLAVTSAATNLVTIYSNDGTGDFSDLGAIQTGLKPQSVAVADVNDDGSADILTVNQGEPPLGIVPSLAVHVATGGGAFDPAVEYPVDLGPTSLLALDLNNDGAVDAVTVNKEANTASILVNEGDGTFSSAVHLLVGVEPRDIAAMDADLDGDADLFIVADIAGEPFVQLVRNDLNNGQLLFAVARAISTQGNALLVRTGDVDDDQIPDLIAVNEPPDVPGPTEASVSSLLNISEPAHEATLTDFTVAFGSLISGVLQDLVESDNSSVRARSRFGFLASEPNVVDLQVGAVTTVQNPVSLDLTVEGRINQSAGTSKLRLRNWSTNAFQQVHQYPIGSTEVVASIENVPAANRVRQSDGRIELSIRQSVIATFTVFGFDSFTDQVMIAVH